MVVVTNNKLVITEFNKNKYDGQPVYDIIYIDGNAEELLIKVRDMVYAGYPLITHPLAASISMLYSPYRTVILGSCSSELNQDHAEIAEQSLSKYRQCTENRTPDVINNEDYKQLDLELFVKEWYLA